MKKVFRFVLLAVLISAGATVSTEAKSQQVDVNFSVFQNSLKPYGNWRNHPKYGQVWTSHTRGFKPYSTGGHWTNTDYGWTWVSDYDWGWAPFHYGRWAYERSYGWYWVPGYEWAPAWVAWRNNNDYYGWAPLSPGIRIDAGFVDINIIPHDRWNFTQHRYITDRYVSRHYMPRSRNTIILKNTTVINNVNIKNNVRFVAGPRKEDVERVNHVKIQTYTIGNSSRPGKTVVNKNTINVYRPIINKNDKTVNNTTVVNKNSNNTTVNKNNNNTTKENTTVNNNSNNKTDNDKTTVNNNTKDHTDKPKDKTKNKDQQQKTKEQKQQDKNNKNKPENTPPQVKHSGNVQSSDVAKNKPANKQNGKMKDETSKKNNDDIQNRKK